MPCSLIGGKGCYFECTSNQLAKAYEISTYLEDRITHDAMNVPHVFRELFIHCGEVSEVGAIPLRACIMEIFQNWSNLGFTGRCPFSFKDEINTHKHQFNEYQAWHEVQRLALECIDTNAEGRVSPQLDITEKRRQNKELPCLCSLSEWLEKKTPRKR